MELTLDPITTALVFIDLQRGIVARELAPHSSADVVKNAAALAVSLRSAGGTVIYVHVLPGEILQLPVDQSWGGGGGTPPPSASEIVPEAGLQEGDLIITKRQWGAFYGTNLEQALRRKNIRTIVLGGIATNFGVESTARAAHDMGYELVFAEDASSSMAAEAHEFTFKNIFPRMGRVRSTEEVLKSW